MRPSGPARSPPPLPALRGGRGLGVRRWGGSEPVAPSLPASTPGAGDLREDPAPAPFSLRPRGGSGRAGARSPAGRKRGSPLCSLGVGQGCGGRRPQALALESPRGGVVITAVSVTPCRLSWRRLVVTHWRCHGGLHGYEEGGPGEQGPPPPPRLDLSCCVF